MKVVIVGYLNTLPFIHGLEYYGIEIVRAHPSKCADLLHSGKLDFGLIPLGALEEERSYYHLKDYGISCDGAVRTVCLFGQTPIEEWEEVVLDYQSRTSVLLSKLLLRSYYHLNPAYISGEEGYEESISDNRGGLIIGDRVFDYENVFPYKYDLGEIWKQWTGLPFVFAVWVGLKPLPKQQKELLNEALDYGLKNFEMPSSMVKLPIEVDKYFKKNIEYDLNKSKQKALQIFLHNIGKSKLKLIEL